MKRNEIIDYIEQKGFVQIDDDIWFRDKEPCIRITFDEVITIDIFQSSFSKEIYNYEYFTLEKLVPILRKPRIKTIKKKERLSKLQLMNQILATM